MRHEIASDLTAGVREPQIEEEPRRLDAARAQENGIAALPSVLAVLTIYGGDDPAGAIAFQLVDGATLAYLGAVRDSQRQIGRIHAGLGGVAAALMAGTVRISVCGRAVEQRWFGLSAQARGLDEWTAAG